MRKLTTDTGASFFLYNVIRRDKSGFGALWHREAERKVSPAFSKAADSKGRAFWQGFGAIALTFRRQTGVRGGTP